MTLTPGAANPDTIHIAKGDSPFTLVNKIPTGFDRVTGFDTNDKLDLPSSTIMPTTSILNGVDVGTIARHSITNGVIKFYSTLGTTPLTIGENNSTFGSSAGNAYKYLVLNCLPSNVDKAGAFVTAGHTVVIEAHSSGGITVVDLVGTAPINTVMGDII